MSLGQYSVTPPVLTDKQEYPPQLDINGQAKVVLGASDPNGVVVQRALSAASWSYAPPTGGIVNSTAGVIVKAAAGAGVRNYILMMQIDADTLGAASELVIRDGAAGTVLWRGKLQTTPAGRFVKFDPPLRGSANTLVEVATLTATVSGGVLLNLQGFTGI